MAVKRLLYLVTYHVVAHLFPSSSAVELVFHFLHTRADFRVDSASVISRISVRNVVGKASRILWKWLLFFGVAL